MLPEAGAWTTMTAVDHERVSHRRKLVSKMISGDALKAFGPRGNEYLDTFCRNLAKNIAANGWSSPKNMTVECQELQTQLKKSSLLIPGKKLLVDIMSDFAFGQEIDLMNNPELSFILDVQANYAWRMGIYKESPSLALLQFERIMSFLGTKGQYGRSVQWFEKYSSAILDVSREKRRGRFALFQNSVDPITESALSRVELSAEGFFLMLAGERLASDNDIHYLTGDSSRV